MTLPLRVIACIMFVLSGAASVSYQTIWLRDAMTHFGVITPVISSVLSVFMLGLAIGTVCFGRISRNISPRKALIYYTFVELLIGIIAIIVPQLFNVGHNYLLSAGAQDSGSYLFLSWLIITIILLPVCTLIGATFPLVMRFIEKNSSDNNNFGFLYFSNLAGGFLGCLIPLATIELFGFNTALHITAVFNLLIVLLAVNMLFVNKVEISDTENQTPPEIEKFPKSNSRYYAILFISGFAALGSEVLWLRAFTPAVGTTIYAFAEILAIYLICNFIGTSHYINQSKLGLSRKHLAIILFLLPLSALLPIAASGIFPLKAIRALSVLSISVVCFCFGYLLPYITDRLCNNNPEKAAKAYTFNFAGCITGPLFTTYILFPAFGLKLSMLLYAAPLLFVSYVLFENKKDNIKAIVAFILMAAGCLLIPNKEDDYSKNGMLHRDHVGYIGATGEGMLKKLEVNGIGMTNLTTITKNMAHLPMSYEPNAKSALVICLGMGTTLRSFTTWPDLEHITVVELSHGVKDSFGYFHDDAARVLADKRVNIVVDDGRRYLNRTNDTYDIVVIDPPPPISAAGSGLLYTTEFIGVLKSRMNKDGILAHWLPIDKKMDYTLLNNAVINAIKQHFKHVIIYQSIEGWGIHILASDRQLNKLSVNEYINSLPEKAKEDLEEWYPGRSMSSIAEDSLIELNESDITLNRPDIFMSDDRLYNEFYMINALIKKQGSGK